MPADEHPRRGTARTPPQAWPPEACTALSGGGAAMIDLDRLVAATPAELPQIGAVGDAEVLKGHEEALIDCLPKPQFDGDALVEPLGDVLAVEALGCRSQPEKLRRLEVIEEPVVGRGSSVMELVDHDDVECG